MSSKLILTLSAGLFASAAFAQSAPSTPQALDRGARLQQQMQILDKDGDGAISREEASGHKFLAKQFDQIDANKDGKLAAEELQSFRANKRAKHAARFEEQFKEADKNGDGVLTKPEAESSNLRGLAKHFDQIDANHDGQLTKQELQAAFSNIHNQRARHGMRFEERFKAADKDGDGALTKEEAKAAKLNRIVQGFDQIDANRDGKVTLDELRSLKQAHLRQ